MICVVGKHGLTKINLSRPPTCGYHYTMARKAAPKQRHDGPSKTGEESLSTSTARFVSDMMRFIEENCSPDGNFTVEELLQRNKIDNSDRETALTLRKCGKKISIN